MTGLAADRRTFLKGLGVLGAAALVPGCAISSKRKIYASVILSPAVFLRFQKHFVGGLAIGAVK